MLTLTGDELMMQLIIGTHRMLIDSGSRHIKEDLVHLLVKVWLIVSIIAVPLHCLWKDDFFWKSSQRGWDTRESQHTHEKTHSPHKWEEGPCK